MKKLLIALPCALAIAVLLLWLSFSRIHGSDPWQGVLSQENNQDTLEVGRAGKVIYRVVLNSSSVKQRIELAPGRVKAEGWRELHSDETVLPGPWVLKYRESRLIAVTENWIEVDGNSFPPGSRVEVTSLKKRHSTWDR